MPLKRLVISIFALFLLVHSYAQQQTADLGVYVGGAIPFSDYSKTNLLQSVGFDYGGFYRYNFNTRYSVRINALYGTVKQSGFMDDKPVAPFSKSVFDLGAYFEINYLDFLMGEERMRFSPYVFYGIGLSYFTGVIAANIPIGTGVKYAFDKRWSVGVEASTRKLMSDKLDNYNDPYSTIGLTKVNSWMHNNDWINYIGLTLTYKFYWGKTPCPAYGRIND